MRNQYKILSEKYMNEVVTPAREEDVNPAELAKGIKVEMEHTKNPEEAKRIALQHLAEIEDYYTQLEKLNAANKAHMATHSDPTHMMDMRNL